MTLAFIGSGRGLSPQQITGRPLAADECLGQRVKRAHGLKGRRADDTVFGVARPSALEAAGTLGSLPEIFIDCQWASTYLTGGGPADQIGE